jgi:hypothetical protein
MRQVEIAHEVQNHTVIGLSLGNLHGLFSFEFFCWPGRSQIFHHPRQILVILRAELDFVHALEHCHI